jgi:hypothetical protein
MNVKEIICVVFDEDQPGGTKFTISARELEKNQGPGMLESLFRARLARAAEEFDETTERLNNRSMDGTV